MKDYGSKISIVQERITTMTKEDKSSNIEKYQINIEERIIYI